MTRKTAAAAHHSRTNFGTQHNWVRGETAQVGAAPPEAKRTEWQCAGCACKFVHYYDLIRNIEEAMRTAKIDSRCTAFLEHDDDDKQKE